MNGGRRRPGRRDRRANPYAIGEAEVAARLASIVAALDGAGPELIQEFHSRTARAEQVWDAAGSLAEGWRELCSLIADEARMLGGDRFRLDAFELAPVLTDAGRAALHAAGQAQPCELVLPAWQGLIEQVQRAHAVACYQQLAADAPQMSKADLLAAYQALPAPTAIGVDKGDGRDSKVRTPEQVITEHEQAGDPLRLSSGIRVLDLLVTAPGHDPGFISPGQGIVLGGQTGAGKTSMAYTILAGLHRHLHLLGHHDNTTVLFFTEQEYADRLRNSGFWDDGPYADHQKGLRLVDVSNSRREIVKGLYDIIAEAEDKAADTGRPITEFAPRVVHLDYLQAIIESGEDESTATKRTAELMHRGVQKLDPRALAQFGEVSYEEHTGRPRWPRGLADHRVAGIYYVQYRKQQGDALLYEEGKAGSDLTNFTLPADGAQDAWESPDGRRWLWEVLPGDMRFLHFSEIRGHGEITQSADVVITLHRSRPYGNPSFRTRSGDYHLKDTRARLIMQKARHGQRKEVAPVAFDVTPDGSHARYYDEQTDRLLENLGLLIADPSAPPDKRAEAEELRARIDGLGTWSRRGDHVFPRPRARRPFVGVSYIDR